MFLIWTHTHLFIMHRIEIYIYLLEDGTLVWGLVLYFWYILYRGIFVGFYSPWGFPRINLCVLLCGCACLSFSDHFAYGYVVMMINVIRYGITIKKLTWYYRYPKRSICATEILLQLQLLNIRVSCFKTLEDKN